MGRPMQSVAGGQQEEEEVVTTSIMDELQDHQLSFSDGNHPSLDRASAPGALPSSSRQLPHQFTRDSINGYGSTNLGNTDAVDGVHHASTPSQESCEDPDENRFTLSFRIMNLTNQSFFKTHLRLFLLTHGDTQIEISRINRYYSDVPLELLELPTTITVDSQDLLSSKQLNISTLPELGTMFELLALLTFTDNRTSRTIEIRKSYKLNEVHWGCRYVDVVSRSSLGTYQVDVDRLDQVEPIVN